MFSCAGSDADHWRPSRGQYLLSSFNITMPIDDSVEAKLPQLRE